MFAHDSRSADYREDEPNFRCPGCEANPGTGRLCDDCRSEEGGEG